MPYLSPQACNSFSLRRQMPYISALGWAWKMGMNSAPKPRPTMATRILSEAMRCSFRGDESRSGSGLKICAGRGDGKEGVARAVGVAGGETRAHRGRRGEGGGGCGETVKR